MDDAANNGNEQPLRRARASLSADALKIISSLDEEIEQLRRLARPGHHQAIAELEEVIAAIHASIDRTPD